MKLSIYDRWLSVALSTAICLGFALVEVADGEQKPVQPDLASLPHVPRQEYSAEQIRSLFRRPASFGELLRNLKVAVDDDLILQPAFNDDALLETFFAGVAVRREAVPYLTGSYSAEDVHVTIDDARFPKMTAVLRQGQHVQLAHDSARGHVPEHLSRSGFIELNVASVPGADVRTVRDVFGQGSWNFDYGIGTDGVNFTPTKKGTLSFDFENGGNSDAPPPFGKRFEQKAAIFDIKLSREAEPPSTTPARQVSDLDQVRNIRVVVQEN